MILWNIFLAKRDMAFRTDEIRCRLLLIDLVVQNAAVIAGRRNVTSLSAAAGFHRDLERLRIERVHRFHVMAGEAVQVRMFSAFMPEGS